MSTKTWKKYEDYLLTGQWHIHTQYTDGKNNVFEYCVEAKKRGIPLICFTEHVRKVLSYDFNEFLDDIERARKEFDLIVLSGCEAKVLPGGELDVEEWVLRAVDYPIFAFHAFPKEYDTYVESLKKVLQNPFVNTWAHPGLFLIKNGLNLLEEDLKQIFLEMKHKDVLLELNGKYGLPPKEWLELAKRYGVLMVRGDDIHSVEEFTNSDAFHT